MPHASARSALPHSAGRPRRMRSRTGRPGPRRGTRAGVQSSVHTERLILELRRIVGRPTCSSIPRCGRPTRRTGRPVPWEALAVVRPATPTRWQHRPRLRAAGSRSSRRAATRAWSVAACRGAGARGVVILSLVRLAALEPVDTDEAPSSRARRDAGSAGRSRPGRPGVRGGPGLRDSAHRGMVAPTRRDPRPAIRIDARATAGDRGRAGRRLGRAPLHAPRKDNTATLPVLLADRGHPGDRHAAPAPVPRLDRRAVAVLGWPRRRRGPIGARCGTPCPPFMRWSSTPHGPLSSSCAIGRPRPVATACPPTWSWRLRHADRSRPSSMPGRIDGVLDTAIAGRRRAASACGSPRGHHRGIGREALARGVVPTR